MPDTVQLLKAQGLNLGIVSSKYRRRIKGVLDREGLGGQFDVIVGGEDVAAFKPDPTGLLSAAASLGTSTANVLDVGDSIPQSDYIRHLRNVDSLEATTRRHMDEMRPEELPLAMEFIVEGLAQNYLLTKRIAGTTVRYSDSLSSMIED